MEKKLTRDDWKIVFDKIATVIANQFDWYSSAELGHDAFHDLLKSTNDVNLLLGFLDYGESKMISDDAWRKEYGDSFFHCLEKIVENEHCTESGFLAVIFCVYSFYTGKIFRKSSKRLLIEILKKDGAKDLTDKILESLCELKEVVNQE